MLAFFASLWVGLILGGKVALVISSSFLKSFEDIGKRLTSALSIFGFLFLPALVGSFTNAKLSTSIELHPIGVHFLWACFAAGIAFFVSPEHFEKGN